MRTKINKFVLVFVVLFLTGLVFVGVWFLTKPSADHSQNTSVKEIPQSKSVKYKSCFVLQTGFTSYQRNINLRELKKSIIYTDTSLVGEIRSHGFENVQGLDLTNVNNFLKNVGDKNAHLMIKPAASSLALKTLYVDNFYFWDRTSISDYPLCFEVEKSGKEEDLYEYQGEMYDFDINKVRSIFAAGEIIPVRAVDRAWLHQSNNYTLLFDRYRDRIEKSDLSLAMLENPISGNPTPCKGCMMFVGDEKNIEGFREVGFDAMGIGNHFGDGGQKALKRSIEVFNEVNIGLPGVSSTSVADASKPFIMNMGDKRVAFLSADDVAAYYWIESNFGSNRYSKKSAAGSIGIVDHDKIVKDITEAKKQADLVIVMVSWGVEYTNKANAHQKEMGRALIDAGADIIIGSHPHWVQQIEFYKGKPIIYSLGNFIFDQTSEGAGTHWSRRKGETRQGMTVELYYNDTELVSMDLIPHKMCGYDQAPAGEASNKVHNLAWKIQSGGMTYAEVDKYAEKDGCVWYQPTPLKETDPMYKQVWDRMMQYYGT